MPSFLSRLSKDQNGQSLVEILVGLAIGALLIGTATIGVVFVVRSSTTNQNLGTAADLTKGILDNVRTFAASNWSNLTGLSHGASSTYFMVASGTTLFAVPGEEGVVGSDVQNGLIGHWGLDEGTGTITYDESGNGYNGTLTGGPVWQSNASCKLGDCLSFSGANGVYVSVPSPTMSLTNQVTVSAWVKLNSPDTQEVVAYQNGFLDFRLSSTNFQVYLNTNNSWASPGYGPITSKNFAPAAGQWYFLTMTYSPNNLLAIYINGQLNNSQTIGVALYPNLNAFTLGYAYSGTGLNGYIDDVRLYNRALSANEVKQMYDSQFFSRYFYVQDVCRTNDASSSIIGAAPCTGSNWDDPLTQEVTAETTWNAGPSTDQTTLSTFLTNYNNFTLRQTDWSGGGGQTGPLSIPNAQYASGTNITGTSTYGSFEIGNLSQQ